MKNKKSKITQHIPFIIYVKKSCLGCPFFELKSHGNSASGTCNADDLERSIDFNTKEKASGHELKITGRYSSSSIIKVPRPKWCPLTIGDAIVTIRNKPCALQEELRYKIDKYDGKKKNNTLTHTYDQIN